MAHKYYVQADLGISLFTRTANLNPIAGTVVKESEGVSIRPSIGVLTRAQQNNPSENMLDLIARIKEAYLKTELV
ncbi:LysR family transcriptional regulator [Brochothrix thermosphacta DSM 20171 = FSL F6-1036]|nr:LysR family transcriptional regulator [Brochothrix thermosphacta DSM 20171 = FSL F6-1036]